MISSKFRLNLEWQGWVILDALGQPAARRLAVRSLSIGCNEN
jgi:hypothetical protein